MISSFRCFSPLAFLWTLLVFYSSSSSIITILSSSSTELFDPYVMNGGLLAAIAGRDYMILATDTRLVGQSGYDILERHTIHSRLWSPITSSRTQSSSSDDDDDSNNDDLMVAPDGSLNINLFEELQKLQQQQQQQQPPPQVSSSSSLRVLRESTVVVGDSPSASSSSTTMIGSVGCQSDCEQLKRSLRCELRTARHFGEIIIMAGSESGGRDKNEWKSTTSSFSMETMSVLLSQVLYSRRTFPFGCYCILGGLSATTGEDDDDGMGQVYVYDAIGSYEQVAIACTGTGFELLQPILDRQFQPLRIQQQPPSSSSSTRTSPPLSSPSRQVDCPTVHEAIEILVRAYRSVAERDIRVGDHVVLYSVQRRRRRNHNNVERDPPHNKDKNDDTETPIRNVVYQSKIWTAPLKKH